MTSYLSEILDGVKDAEKATPRGQAESAVAEVFPDWKGVLGELAAMTTKPVEFVRPELVHVFRKKDAITGVAIETNVVSHLIPPSQFSDNYTNSYYALIIFPRDQMGDDRVAAFIAPVTFPATGAGPAKYKREDATYAVSLSTERQTSNDALLARTLSQFLASTPTDNFKPHWDKDNVLDLTTKPDASSARGRAISQSVYRAVKAAYKGPAQA
jgi:hypothetical protein